MANVDMPVRMLMPYNEAAELAPTGSVVLATMCDTCYAIVPLSKYVNHVQAVHPS